MRRKRIGKRRKKSIQRKVKGERKDKMKYLCWEDEYVYKYT